MINEIRTLPDQLLNNIKIYNNAKKKPIRLKYLAKVTNVTNKQVEFWIEFMEKQNLVEIKYPFNIFADPKITILPIKEKKTRTLNIQGMSKTKLDDYNIISDKLEANVKIWKIPSEDVQIYELTTPKISPGTQALLDGLLDELTKDIPLSSEDVNDPKKMVELGNNSLGKLIEEIKKKLPKESDEIIGTLASILLHSMFGLEDIDVILADNNLEEIAINGSDQPISVYHKKYGWLKTLHLLNSENDIFNLSEHIGRKSGQQINSMSPIMDARLLSGDRVASTLYPISTNGNTITIRRFARKPWTLPQFINPKTSNILSSEMAAFIWLCIQYELNVLIAGGTASGKTSMLNVLSSLIQPTNRIISIEDTREISLPKSLYWNWVPLSSRLGNAEGQGDITMLDLIIASLRMRPDRIIVGEIRKKQQAQALFEAMHTGHSVYATMHADTAQQVKRRLLEPPIEVPKTELGSLHLIVMQFRDRRTGRRRTLEVVEIIDQDDDVELNYLFRWHPRTDTFEKVNKSRRIIEDLSLHTGLSQQDIENDLKEKKNVLQWMIDKEIEDINEVGQVMRVYYKDKDQLMAAIKKGSDLKKMITAFEGKHSDDKAETIERPELSTKDVGKIIKETKHEKSKKTDSSKRDNAKRLMEKFKLIKKRQKSDNRHTKKSVIKIHETSKNKKKITKKKRR